MRLLKTLFSAATVSTVLLVGIFSTSEVKADKTNYVRARDKCFDVSSKKGWQYFDLGTNYNGISITGGWTVDSRNYATVGPQGHNEPGLEPYNQYKYDKNLPFGALLVDIPTDSHGYIWVRGFQKLPKQISQTAIRINDSDNSLGDNSGVLTVCFHDLIEQVNPYDRNQD
ncbi:MAG TPA: hypothetical protein VK203_03550 [Nostocaceae cyanobacterium]|nr:hypothetical protein [Nostocaceae cyanobacterium]